MLMIHNISIAKDDYIIYIEDAVNIYFNSIFIQGQLSFRGIF